MTGKAKERNKEQRGPAGKQTSFSIKLEVSLQVQIQISSIGKCSPHRSTDHTAHLVGPDPGAGRSPSIGELVRERPAVRNSGILAAKIVSPPTGRQMDLHLTF